MAARVSLDDGSGIFNGYRADLNVFSVWCMEQTDTNDRGQKLRWMLENPVAANKKKRNTASRKTA
ncbi:MAG: hypothetical protein V4662_23995 [Verrucomicrobiota bacterium]